MIKFYCVVFDNDPEFPGVMQFCDVASEESYLQGTGTNFTKNLDFAIKITCQMKQLYPEYNYRVVKAKIKEFE